MIVRALTAASVLLIRYTEGLIHFLSELLPILGKLLFISSPLILSVVFSYVTWGIGAAAVAAVFVILLYAVGAASQVRASDASTKAGLSRQVLTVVAIIDVLLLGGSLFSIHRLGVEEPPVLVSTPPPSEIAFLRQAQSASSKANSERIKRFVTAVYKALDVEADYGREFNEELFH
jgi:hypothetical protein